MPEENYKKLSLIFQSIFKLKKNLEKLNQKSYNKWDSIAHMNLIMSIEEEFGIEFKDTEVFELDSFIKIKNYLINKKLL